MASSGSYYETKSALNNYETDDFFSKQNVYSLNPTSISRETTKRLIHDITDIYRNPLHSEGIYYQHDDQNMLKGYALIIGPKDTPYENGFYLFEFFFPENYPQQPPILKFLNCDNKHLMRFNPNLYRNGKVCLSILNTWRGDGWTSSQTIRSVLLTLTTVLCEHPLLNEPGCHKNHMDFDKYNKLVTYKNYQVSFCGILMKELHYPCFDLFYTTMKQYALEHKDTIMKHFYDTLERDIMVTNKGRQIKKEVIQTSMYNLHIPINYDELEDTMKKTFEFIETVNV